MALSVDKKRSGLQQRKEARQGWVFVSPWIIGFLAFTAGPLLFSLYASFTNYDITSRHDWIGTTNYRNMLFHDPLFWKSLWNTFYYVIFSVPLTTLGSLLLAVMLNRKIPGIKIYRTIFYLPSILSGVALYILWQMLLTPGTGLVNVVIGWFGVEGPAWLVDPAWTKPAIILMKLWSVGGGMLLYLASLQNVPEQLYEASEIDGAGVIRRFWHITLPMITPVLLFELITHMIGAFQIFQEGYVMSSDMNTPGSPMNSLLFFNLHMFTKAFKVFDMGYAMALAWFLFVVVIVLTIINMVLSKYWVHYEGGDNR
ncbi:multiple sugar transport system permease protein [Paenibacillus rhizosphaerae]|uniref:Multiple sugar transport system permease protein n=1 Tax=Paenibacillus rhizosphaerae TaxID=297318 RepID=A0A839TSF2_9BACL|nr:sugar ABC transporter permease [Paenibacillus rhizosphaerae]MBB3128590.1 multiple sugar transport system permease protein [Paenibacillus rhizosphaerae]